MIHQKSYKYYLGSPTPQLPYLPVALCENEPVYGGDQRRHAHKRQEQPRVNGDVIHELASAAAIVVGGE